jgi:hypothetical protein
VKGIVPKGICRGTSMSASPWSKIVQRYKDLADHNSQFEPMFGMVSALAASPAIEQLFATTSMHTLLIANQEQFHSDDNVLFVSYQRDTREFEFEHRTPAAKNDRRKCGEAEALQTLSLFIKYKFGVLFDPNPARIKAE